MGMSKTARQPAGPSASQGTSTCQIGEIEIPPYADEYHGTRHKLDYDCSASINFFRSAFGFDAPALVCCLRLSSLMRRASSIVRLSLDAWYTGLGTCRVLEEV